MTGGLSGGYSLSGSRKNLLLASSPRESERERSARLAMSAAVSPHTLFGSQSPGVTDAPPPLPLPELQLGGEDGAPLGISKSGPPAQEHSGLQPGTYDASMDAGLEEAMNIYDGLAQIVDVRPDAVTPPPPPMPDSDDGSSSSSSIHTPDPAVALPAPGAAVFHRSLTSKVPLVSSVESTGAQAATGGSRPLTPLLRQQSEQFLDKLASTNGGSGSGSGLGGAGVAGAAQGADLVVAPGAVLPPGGSPQVGTEGDGEDEHGNSLVAV